MTILNLQVIASTDDCLKQYGDTFYLDFVVQRVGDVQNYDTLSGGGMRFTNVTMPKGAIISTAYLTIRAYSMQDDHESVRSRIRGEAVDDAVTFSDLPNYDGRVRTTAVVDWDNIPIWVGDTDYNSPEIKTIIQEIVNRDGWVSGNDLVIFWDDHEGRSDGQAYRDGYPYDSSATYAPKLHIEYARTSPLPMFFRP